MRTDIVISGRGFYQITATSRRGTRFMAGIEGTESGTAYCDDVRLTEDIADGAIAEGLIVLVNGRPYLGDGRVQA
jgi:hypothetical protein